jgi:hypothetical protein
VVLSWMVGMTLKLTPPTCTLRLPFTWAWIVLASGSLFTTCASEVIVPVSTICTAVRVPRDELNWATPCVWV